MNICQLPQDPEAVSLIKLKELFDSKYGLGSSDKKTTARVMEQVVKHLRDSIQKRGFDIAGLFVRADSNQTNNLDRSEFYYLLY